MEGNVTPKVKEILKTASEEADAYDYKKLEPEHILLAILIDNTNICIDVMSDMAVDIDNLFNNVSDHLNSSNLNPVVYYKGKSKIPPSELTKKILNESVFMSKAWGSDIVDVEHIFLAILSHRCEAKNLLVSNGVTPVTFPVALKNKKIKNKFKMKEYDDQDPGLSNLKKKTDSATPVLDNFCRDLTKLAAEGKIDAVIGRDDEIKRVSQILSRRKKNNPILLGEPGVGKTAIAEGLAKSIVDNTCSRSLVDKKILSLDIASVVAGTKFRGEFEGRMNAIIDELMKNKNVILFLDEIHTIVGAGSSSGALDVSNILKPALGRGDLQVIGATTLKEYRDNIEKDGALTRRFQQVMVNEPSLADTIHILNNIKGNYEDFHRVTYTTEIIEECVKLADRYITDRFMPDKAIDILDECGATTNSDLIKPEELTLLEERLQEITKEKDLVVKKQHYEDAVRLREEGKRVESQIIEVKERWMDSSNKDRTVITVDMLNEVISNMSGVPINKLTEEENEKLISLEENLNAKVIGQEKAVSVISKSIRRNKLGLRNKNKPQGSFIFIGKSGGGKTFMAKTIAEQVYHDPNALIRVDMSEYMEKISMTQLIGAAPGYVGYGEGGKLTEAVRRKPHSVVLFDEIEKAHPDIFNLLLQVLDDGHLTDSMGAKVNFRNTMIIMTSNAGVRELSDFGAMGFDTDTKEESKKNETHLKKSLKKQFPPEFLNRIDDIIVFNDLTEEDVVKIAELNINELRVRLKDMGYGLKISKPAMAYLAKEGFHKEYGARPLDRAIQRLVEDQIAEEILTGKYQEGATIKVGFDSKKNELTFK